MRTQLIRALGGSILVMLMAACGGGGDDGAPPAPAPMPPAAGIGPAGGTVTGPNGATIVVPAGALTQPVDLQITQDSAGAPALPAGSETAGAVYALTPHGTTFAVPITLTVPFDPAQVPAGRSVQLLKTIATQTGWEPVSGASVSGSSLTAQITRFSWTVPALVPAPPTASCVRAMPGRIAMGNGFAAAVSADGGVWTWGRNVDRQLGPGSTGGTDRLQPARVTGISNAVAVFALFDGFAVLRADGRVQGWGATFLRSSFEVPVVDGVGLLDLTSITQVAGGNGHTLALRTDGTVWAWGANVFGQIGDGSRNEPSEPVQVSGLSNVGAIGAPGNASMAVRSDGTLWAWGNKDADVCLGPGMAAILTPQQVSTTAPFGAIATGNHTLLWNPVGELRACGSGAVSTVFAGADTPQPVAVPPVAAAASGGYYDGSAAQITPFILTIDGSGVLNGYSAPAAGASGVNGFANACEVTASGGSALFVRADGTVWAWGDNDYGQLGDGTRARRTAPVQVMGLNLN